MESLAVVVHKMLIIKIKIEEKSVRKNVRKIIENYMIFCYWVIALYHYY